MVKIKNSFVSKRDLPELIKECKKILNKGIWKSEYDEFLGKLLNDEKQIYKFNDLDELVKSLLEDRKKKMKGAHQIPADRLEKAKILRKIHRLGRLFELSHNQVGDVAPGVHKLPPDQLLPLDHYWNTANREQRQRWQKTTTGKYLQLKPKGLLADKETKVLAFGAPDNPSMLYWQGSSDLGNPGIPLGRQIGHRYQASPKGQRVNHSKANQRTYGGKKGNTGEYKVKGMVDGHAIQAQDDQANLDPKVKNADGHIENMYWENALYGAKIRKNYFEQYALDNFSWFTQVNEYENHEPGHGKVATHDGNRNAPVKVDVPHTVHVRAINVCSEACKFYYVKSVIPPTLKDIEKHQQNLDKSLPLLFSCMGEVWVCGLDTHGKKKLSKLSDNASNYLSKIKFAKAIKGPINILPQLYGEIAAKNAHAKIGHWKFDNTVDADYTDLEYRLVSGTYKRATQTPTSRDSLGRQTNSPHGKKATPPHADANRVNNPGFSEFPTAQIVQIDKLDTLLEENFFQTRLIVGKDYETPPATPNYLSPRDGGNKNEVKENEKLNGAYFEGTELKRTGSGSEFISAIKAHNEKKKGCTATILTILHGGSEKWKLTRIRDNSDVTSNEEPDTEEHKTPPPKRQVESTAYATPIQGSRSHKALLASKRLSDGSDDEQALEKAANVLRKKPAPPTISPPSSRKQSRSAASHNAEHSDTAGSTSEHSSENEASFSSKNSQRSSANAHSLEQAHRDEHSGEDRFKSGMFCRSAHQSSVRGGISAANSAGRRLEASSSNEPSDVTSNEESDTTSDTEEHKTLPPKR